MHHELPQLRETPPRSAETCHALALAARVALVLLTVAAVLGVPDL